MKPPKTVLLPQSFCTRVRPQREGRFRGGRLFCGGNLNGKRKRNRFQELENRHLVELPQQKWNYKKRQALRIAEEGVSVILSHIFHLGQCLCMM